MRQHCLKIGQTYLLKVKFAKKTHKVTFQLAPSSNSIKNFTERFFNLGHYTTHDTHHEKFNDLFKITYILLGFSPNVFHFTLSLLNE
jgi:hypothetical protein